MAVDYSKEKEVDVWSYRTGIAVEIPAGYVGWITPRSSIYRTGSMLCNSVGVIDSDYRGGDYCEIYRQYKTVQCGGKDMPAAYCAGGGGGVYAGG